MQVHFLIASFYQVQTQLSPLTNHESPFTIHTDAKYTRNLWNPACCAAGRDGLPRLAHRTRRSPAHASNHRNPKAGTRRRRHTRTRSRRYAEGHTRANRSAEASNTNSCPGRPRSAKISFASAAHHAQSDAKRNTRNPTGNCPLKNDLLPREEGLPSAGCAVGGGCVPGTDVARPRISSARRTNKPARTPRRSLRTNSRRRSETLVRLRAGLPLLSGSTRRRKAKCHRQRREIDRSHTRTRRCRRRRKRRHVLATFAPKRALVRHRSWRWSSCCLRHRPLPLTRALIPRCRHEPPSQTPALELSRCPALATSASSQRSPLYRPPPHGTLAATPDARLRPKHDLGVAAAPELRTVRHR